MTFVHFKQLKVYQLAYRTALDIHQLTEKFPKEEKFGLVDQMRRASRSVCANIAEGLSRKTSVVDELRFLRIALGSCAEMQVWLDFSSDLKYLDEDMCKTRAKAFEEVGNMLYALMRKREEVRA